ncbi:MAG: glycosyltransferase family A protein [Anaerolineae bacterium]|nr:glycosyltransferase family A protein [Anaerolineae bacterium]
MKLISVIMATYNRESYIQGALESILRQNYAPMEIIVIDDGSTDRTPEIVAGLIEQRAAPIRYVRQENQGQPSAFNHALRLARGEIIAFLDDDDLWPADRLPTQLDYFVQGGRPGEEIGIVLGKKDYFADGVKVNDAEMAAANQRPYRYSLGAALLARWVFERVGVFDEHIGYVSDWDWFARARALEIPTAIDPRITLLGRIHAGNITQNRELGAKLTVEMIRRHMRRKEDQA